MNNPLKRLLSLLVCLCMVLGMLPGTALTSHAEEACAHVDEDSDFWCDNCGRCATHTFVHGYFEITETHHYLECDRCSFYDEAQGGAHEDGDDDNCCDICGGCLVHSFAWDVFHKTETHHYSKCDNCSYYDETQGGAHEDEDGDGLCDECEFHMEECSYTWFVGNYFDEAEHELTCICGNTILEEHANEDSDELCDECRFHMEECSYVWEEGNGITADEHLLRCHCGEPLWADHVDEDDDMFCDVCGGCYSMDHSYSWEEGYLWDEESHQLYCSACGYYGWEDHIGSPCEVCGYSERPSISVYLRLEALDENGEIIEADLDAKMNEEYWVSNFEDQNSYVYIEGENILDFNEDSFCPEGYSLPEDITFTADEDGTLTITSGNAELRVEDGVNYIVVTLELFVCPNHTDGEEIDHYCDEFDSPMPELCEDEDDDHLCDVCWCRLESLCADDDSDHYCDVCDYLMTECDGGEDHICDICGDTLPCEDLDEDGECDVCGKAMVTLAPVFSGLSYEQIEENEVLTSGTLTVSVAAGENAVSGGTVTAQWEAWDFDAQAIKKVEVTGDVTSGTAVLNFSGIRLYDLEYCVVTYNPAEGADYASVSVNHDVQDDIPQVYVSATGPYEESINGSPGMDKWINGLKSYLLYVPQGETVNIKLNMKPGDSVDEISFNGGDPVGSWNEDQDTYTFTMPETEYNELNVYIDILHDHTQGVDEDKDHWCDSDVCYKTSASTDDNGDNVCDICGKGLLQRGNIKSCIIDKIFKGAREGDIVKLLADHTDDSINAYASVSLYGGGWVILDLNGFTLSAQDSDYLFSVDRDCILTIIDSSQGQTGSMTNPGGKALLEIDNGQLDLRNLADPDGITIYNNASVVASTGHTGEEPVMVHLPEGYALKYADGNIRKILTGKTTVTVAVEHYHAPDGTTGKCECGEVIEASLTIGESTFYYLSLQQVLDLAEYTVAADRALVTVLVPLDGAYDIIGGVFTLDLNGQAITGGDTNVLCVSGGDVTLVDSGTNGSIKGTSTRTSSAAVAVDGGKLTVAGGTITGDIRGIQANGGELVVTGGNVTALGEKQSAGIHVNGGTVAITGGSVSDDYAIRLNSGNLLVTGGTITGEARALYATGGTAEITGGTFVNTEDSDMWATIGNYGGDITITGGSISGALNDINISDGTTVLGLGENGVGATFPGGISLSEGDALSDLLDAGAAYWQGDKMIVLDEGAGAITGGDVTIKAECDHANGTKTDYTWYFDDHIFTWTCCGIEDTEAHTQALKYENLESVGHKAFYPCCQKAEDVEAEAHVYENNYCVCGKAEEFTLSFYLVQGDETPIATFSVPVGTILVESDSEEDDSLGVTDYLKNLIAQIDSTQVTREHYTFAGWDFEFIPFAVYGDCAIYALWEPVRYSITWDLAGGYAENPNALPNGQFYDSIVSYETNILKEGYVLSHFVDQTGKRYDITKSGFSDIRVWCLGDMPGYDVIFTAVWTCAHASTNAVDNGDGTHKLVCTNEECAGYVVNESENHYDYTYTASGDTITAFCGACGGEAGTLTLVKPENLTYDGAAKTVTVTQTPAGIFADVPAVSYVGNRIDAGVHTASLTYGGVTATLDFTVEKAVIGSVSIDVTAPAAGAVPQTAVEAGNGYSAAIRWNAAVQKFDFNTAYTTTVTLTADGNHIFAEGITVAGWNVENTNGVLTLTRTFVATRKAKLLSVTSPVFDKLNAYHTDAAGAIAELPATVTYTTESGEVRVAIEWSCANYFSTPETTNTFVWTVKAGQLASYDVNSIATSGSITVTNADPVPVTNTGKDITVTYDGNEIDLRQLFTLDENAGAADYTIIGLTGEGTFTTAPYLHQVTKAGTFTVKVTTAANGAYAAGEATATLTVNKAAGTGSVTIEGWTYGEDAKAPVAVGGKGEVTFTYSTADGKVPVNAGTYTVTATFAATDLYEEATATAEFTIAKAQAVITMDTATIRVTYGETVNLPVATANFGTVVCSTTASDLVNAGTYVVTYSVAGTDNYKGASKTVTVVIAQKAVAEPTVTGSYTYTGNEQTVALAGVESYMTVSGDKAVNAGSYEVVITLDGNHKWADGSDGKLSWSIGKAKAEIAMNTDPITVTYGETVTLPNASTNFGTVTCDKTAEELVNAGEYTVTYTVAGTDNFDGTSKTVTVTIEKLAVAEPAVTGSYTYTGKEQTVTLTGVESCMTITSGNKAVNAGSYEAVITLDGNHKWADGSDGKLSWSIGKAQAKITLNTDPITATYGETVTLPTANSNFGTVICDKTAADLKDAGTYTVTYTVEATNNYDGDTKSVTVTINRKAITGDDVALKGALAYSGSELTQPITVTEGITYEVTGNKATEVGTYELTVTGTGNYTGEVKLSWTIKAGAAAITTAPVANKLTYNGMDQMLVTPGTTADGTLVYSLSENGEYTETVPAVKDAGNYTVWYYVLGDANHADTAKASVAVTVEKARLTVTAEDHSITYGDAPANAGVSYTGFVNNETNAVLDGELAYAYDYAQFGNVGTYTITPGGLTSGNYEITFVPGELTVAQKTITVKADAVAKTYGEADPELTYQAEGLVNGDGLKGELKRAAGEDAGTYTIELGTVSGDNYAITYVGADLTISKRSVTITAKDQTIPYGSKISAAEITAAGLAEGHTVTVTLTPSTANVTADGTITASAAVITADGADVTANYEISYAGGKLVIKPDIANIEDLTSENVTSENEDDIKAVQDMLENADSLDETWKDILDKCDELMDRIDEVEAKQKEASDAAEAYDEQSINSSDEAELEELAKDIEALLDTKNLTDDERTALEETLDQVEDMLDTIADTAEDSKAASDVIDALTPEKVTSADQQGLKQAIDAIEELLSSGHLTEEERKALADAKAEAEEMLQIIEKVKDAANTENTEKAENVTSENVKPGDKGALEDAKADLNKALEENSGNYTEEEQKEILSEIQRIENAIQTLEKVEDVTDTITQLPETVEPDDDEAAEKILDAKASYDALTDHEKSLVDETTRKKLDDLVAALIDYDIIKGDGSRWTVGGGGSLSFTANGSFSKFVGIEVDGTKVDAKHYEAKAGSTIITLKQSFLKTLSVGKHTITVLYTDGETSGTFEIQPKPTNPATGDESHIVFWMSAMILSTAAFAALILDSRKRRHVK